jgi:hypothetical protein
LDASSIIGNITHKGLVANRSYFSNNFESEVSGTIDSVEAQSGGGFVVHIRTDDSKTKSYPFTNEAVALVKGGDSVKTAGAIARGSFINKVFYIDMARLGLLLMFSFVAWQVHRATLRRKRSGVSSNPVSDDDDLL